MKQISQFSLHVSDASEKIHDLSFFQPLESPKRTSSPKQLTKAKEKPKKGLKRFALNLLRWSFSKERKNQEAVFKTAVALLLNQSPWQSDSKRKLCLDVAKKVAKIYGIQSDEQGLTCIGKRIELENNPKQLALQQLLIGEEAIKQVHCLLLDEMDRLPIESNLEVTHLGGTESFNLRTCYRKYKVHSINEEGLVTYQYHDNKGTSSIRTKESIFPDVRGVVGQRLVEVGNGDQLLGSYSGELNTEHHVLEQILCLLDLKGQSVNIVQSRPGQEVITILFTSLFGWNELESIYKQRDAIQRLHQKTLLIGDRVISLKLIYMNIPLNAWARLPTPAETGAVLNDLNDQALICLTYIILKSLCLPTTQLEQWMSACSSLESDFFQREAKRLDAIDAFRSYKQELLYQLEMRKEKRVRLLKCLLTQKRLDERALRGVDYLIYLEDLTKELGIKHHKNCDHSLFRSSAAKAADKAQYVFRQLIDSPFLPGSATPDQHTLFSSLYTLYLMWEEPELHAAMSTGECETFYSTVQKNPEINRYLSGHL